MAFNIRDIEHLGDIGDLSPELCIRYTLPPCDFLTRWCRWRTRWCGWRTLDCDLRTWDCEELTLIGCRRLTLCPARTVIVACESGSRMPGCLGGSRIDPGELIRDDLAVLRQELEQTLKNLQRLEEAMPARTAESLAERERELEAELQRLRQQRQNMEKGGEGQGGGRPGGQQG
jgi:hypothetical protein